MPENKDYWRGLSSKLKNVVTITETREDAEALKTDSLWMKDEHQLVDNIDFIESYRRVFIAMTSKEKAQTIIGDLQAMDDSLNISLMNENAFGDNKTLKNYLATQNMSPRTAIDTLRSNARTIMSGCEYRYSDANCSDAMKSPDILTGIPELDAELSGLRFGEVTVITGLSTHGKSTFTNQMILSAIDCGRKCAVFSAEIPATTQNAWLRQQAAGEDGTQWDYNSAGSCVAVVPDMELRNRIEQKLQEYCSFWDWERRGVDFEQLLRWAENRAECGYSLFIIDNIMTLTPGGGEEEYATQAKVIERLVRFAQEMNVHVVVVAHAKKSSQKGGPEIKDMSEVSGSSKLTNWPHQVLAVHRYSKEEKDARKGKPVPEADAQVRVLKCRQTGSMATIYLKFDTKCRRFYGDDGIQRFSWENPRKEPVKADASVTDAGGLDDTDLPFQDDKAEGEQAGVYDEDQDYSKIVNQDPTEPPF